MIPPILADLTDAGFGPSFLLYLLRIRLAAPPVKPHPKVAVSPLSVITEKSKPLPDSISMESEIVCPLKLVPPALKVTGIFLSLQNLSRRIDRKSTRLNSSHVRI